MSWLERATLVQALRPVAIWLWFLSAQGPLVAVTDLRLLGWQMLMLIVATVVVGIVIQVLAIILTVATGDTANEFEDERDKLIEARATVTGFTLSGLGFLAGVLALWQGWGAVWALNLVLGGMVAAGRGGEPDQVHPLLAGKLRHGQGDT